MGIKQHFWEKHPWTRETDSNEFWVFSKMTHHSSLIPRSYQLFKMAIMSNIVVDVKIPTHVHFTNSKSPGLPDIPPPPTSWGKPLIGALRLCLKDSGNKMEWSVSVSPDRNIWDHLWRWSTCFGRNIPPEVRRYILHKLPQLDNSEKE